jgi:hypothetical protein
MTCCEYCKKHGITCVPRWGPKKEEGLQLAKQLPTPDDAGINELDGRRLHFLRSCYFKTTPHLNLVQKIMAFYGPSIQSSSLRFAVLAAYEHLQPFQGSAGTYLISATNFLAKKALSSLDEGDMVAIAFISFWRHYYINIHLPEGDTVLDRLPSSSFYIRRFFHTLKRLLENSGGTVNAYPFASCWRYVAELVMDVQIGFSDDMIWESLAMLREHFGPMDLNQFVEVTKNLETAKSFGVTPSEYWYTITAYVTISQRNGKVASLGFWTVIQKDLKNEFERTHWMLAALEEVRASIDCLEATSVHRDVLLASATQWIVVDTAFGARTVLSIAGANSLWATKLFLALILDGPTIRQATTTQRAIEAAIAVVFKVKFYVSSPIPLKGPTDPVEKTLLNNGLEVGVAWVYIATLVHPISQILEGTYYFGFQKS